VKKIVSIAERIENIRSATGCSLEEIRGLLAISRGMFHYIRTGERTPSRKILAKLEAAERAAGIAPQFDEHLARLALAKSAVAAVPPAEQQAALEAMVCRDPPARDPGLAARLRQIAAELSAAADRLDPPSPPS
jgi:transcriptional regulator with XRE-family HTH domain